MLVLPKHRGPVPSPRLPGAAADALCRWDTSPDARPRGSPGPGCGAARGEQQGHGLTRAECVQEAWGWSGPADPRDEWSGLCPVH